MINIGSLEFFPPLALRRFTSVGSTRLYALVTRNGPDHTVVYIGKSIELAGGGIAKTHHAVQSWRCFGRKVDELFACESAEEFDDAELVYQEVRLVAQLRPELNAQRAANDPEPWWASLFHLGRPEGSL